jgi:hypothetical protein
LSCRSASSNSCGRPSAQSPTAPLPYPDNDASCGTTQSHISHASHAGMTHRALMRYAVWC